MENSIDNLTEDTAAFAQSGSHYSDFFQANYTPGPGDEDDEPTEEPAEEEDNGDENPPVDPDIIFSPVPTQTGGKPPKT